MPQLGNVLYNVIDDNGNFSNNTFQEVTARPDGSPVSDDTVDNVMYVKVGNSYFKRDYTDGIDPRWFGAKGNARFVDGNPGSPTYTQAFTDAAFTDPAHDDTQAFKDAFAFLNQDANRLGYKNGGSTFGHLGGRAKIKLGVGYFYITDSKILSTLGLGGGANAGFIIEGAGEKNTVLAYRFDGEAADDYLFYDNDKYPDMAFRNFRIDGLTGKEKCFYQSSVGNSQNWNISNVEFGGVLRGIDISGLFNADKAEYRKIKYTSYVTGNSFFRIIDNPQSVAHTFYQCDITVGGEGSTLFNVNAGSISIFGGSYTAVDKATLYKISTTGVLLATWALAINSFGSRLEVHGDARYIDSNIGVITVTGEDCTNFPESDGKAKIIIRNSGAVKFDRCSFADIKVAFQVTNGSTYAYDHKPVVEFFRCMLPHGDYISTCAENYLDYEGNVLASVFFPNTSGLGRVVAKDCYTVGSQLNSFNDGAPFADRAFLSRTYTKRIAIVKAHPSFKFGLPATINGSGQGAATEAVGKIPIGCTVIRVGIVKSYSSQDGTPGPQTWHIKSNRGAGDVVLATLTTANIYSQLAVFSTEMWARAYDENTRTFTLYADPANADYAAEGYMVIEYI